jgi:enoyl-CoA hydratase
MSQSSFINSERLDRVLKITINRPEALNAMNSEVLSQLTDALEQAAQDREARVVIITGAGDRAFIAGADIKEMSTKSPLEGRDFAKAGHQATRMIEEMDKPVIAAINGAALGGGCEVALACDIRIASDKARLGQPEVGLGIMPGWGGTVRLARLVGEGKAREIVFSGGLINAEEALRIGLVNSVVPPDRLEEETMKLATTIASKAPLAVAYAKRSMNHARHADTASAAELEADLFGLCFSTQDQREGMGAFVEKRSPEFSGR